MSEPSEQTQHDTEIGHSAEQGSRVGVVDRLRQVLPREVNPIFSEKHQASLQKLVDAEGDLTVLSDQELGQVNQALMSFERTKKDMKRRGVQEYFSNEAGFTDAERTEAEKIVTEFESVAAVLGEACSREHQKRTRINEVQGKLRRGEEMLAEYPEYQGIQPIDAMALKMKAEARTAEIATALQGLNLDNNDDLALAAGLRDERDELESRTVVLDFVLNRG